MFRPAPRRRRDSREMWLSSLASWWSRNIAPVRVRLWLRHRRRRKLREKVLLEVQVIVFGLFLEFLSSKNFQKTYHLNTNSSSPHGQISPIDHHGGAAVIALSVDHAAEGSVIVAVKCATDAGIGEGQAVGGGQNRRCAEPISCQLGGGNRERGIARQGMVRRIAHVDGSADGLIAGGILEIHIQGDIQL